MKTVIRTIACMVLFSTFTLRSLTAQNLGGGLILGLNASQVDGDLYGGFNRAGIHVGGFVNYAFSDVFHLQPELVFEQLGSADKNVGLIFKMNYISLAPIMEFKVPIQIGFSTQDILFHVGPAFGLLLKAEDLDGEVDFFNDMDARILGGIGYRGGRITLALRYAYSLSTIVGESTGNPLFEPNIGGVFHNYVNISLRYHFTRGEAQ